MAKYIVGIIIIIICFCFRYYQRNKEHQLRNVPHVDNSLKWAGGGFLSTVSDLLQFGNAMLYSFQYEEKSKPKDVAFHPTPFSPINNGYVTYLQGVSKPNVVFRMS